MELVERMGLGGASNGMVRQDAPFHPFVLYFILSFGVYVACSQVAFNRQAPGTGASGCSVEVLVL